MLQALATGCGDYDSCWHPVAIPDGFPFVSAGVAIAWAALFLLSLIVLIRRLGRG